MKTLRPLANALVQTPVRSSSLQCRTPGIGSESSQFSKHPRSTQHRTFLGDLFGGSQILDLIGGRQVIKATRTLHYPARQIFEVISDVSQYQDFIPYCRGSVVTKTSNAAKDGKSYAEEAKLSIGFNNDVSEEFWSRVYCVPDTVVEAVSGRAETTLTPEEIEHHNARPPVDQDPTREGRVLSQLLTRWVLRPFPYKPSPDSAKHSDATEIDTKDIPGEERTDVSLAIEFQFANPAYGAMSQAAAPKVAEKMIDAFEKRVKAVVEGS